MQEVRGSGQTRSGVSPAWALTSRAKRPKSALPLAFTEHGALALASVLRSDVAIGTSIMVTRAFVAIDINESTRAQLDAISEALAEFQAKEPRQQTRRRIGFIQDDK